MTPTDAQIIEAKAVIWQKIKGQYINDDPDTEAECLLMTRAALTAAAEIGQESPVDWLLRKSIDNNNVTIERCAQVAYKRAKAFAGDAQTEIEHVGDLIMALKDKE